MTPSKNLAGRQHLIKIVRGAICLLVVFAAAVAGAILTPSARAENNPPVTGSIDFDRTGSLTITKFEKTDQNGITAGNGEQQTVSGNTLAGITFTLTQVDNFDLRNADNWANLDKLSISGNTVYVDGKDSGAKLAQTSQSQTTDSNGQAVFQNLPVALYYVQEAGTGDHIVTQPAEPFFVTIPYPKSKGEHGDWPYGQLVEEHDFNYDVYVYPKNSLGKTPNAEKNVDVKDALKAGDTIGWNIDQEVPQSAASPTRFGIVDKLHSALAYQQASVYALDSHKNVVKTFVANTDYTVGIDGQTVTVEFTEGGLAQLTDYSLVRFSIDTTVKQASNGSIPNDAFPIVNGYDPFHSDPDNPPVHTQTKPVFGAYQFKKVGRNKNTVYPEHDYALFRSATSRAQTTFPGNEVGNIPGSNSSYIEFTKLEGAEFTLWRKPVEGCVAGQYTDTNIKTMTAVSGSNGMVAFNGILVGSAATEQADDSVSAPFCLQETKAPAGYKKNLGVYEITVNGGPFNKQVVTFENEPANGTRLPMTGSTGIIAITGAAIFAGIIAIGLIIKTRRTHIDR